MAGGGGDYTRKRRLYCDVSRSFTFTAATDDTTLITARNALETIFIQRIIVFITTSTAATETFQDHITGKVIGVIPTNPGANSRWDFDWGPEGMPLTVGENFLWNVSVVGHAGSMVIEAFSKRTGVGGSTAGASLQ